MDPGSESSFEVLSLYDTADSLSDDTDYRSKCVAKYTSLPSGSGNIEEIIETPLVQQKHEACHSQTEVLSPRAKRKRSQLGSEGFIRITKDLCWKCGTSGHNRRVCARQAVLFCSRCGKIGRMSRDCPCDKITDRSRASRSSKSVAVQVHLVSRFRSDQRRATQEKGVQCEICTCSRSPPPTTSRLHERYSRLHRNIGVRGFGPSSGVRSRGYRQ